MSGARNAGARDRSLPSTRAALRRGLALAAALLASFAPQVFAQGIPGFTPAPSGAGDILSDGAYAVEACFDNLSPSNTGYSPTLEVVVPAGSTLGGATFSGNAQAIDVVGTCATPGGCPTGFVNPDTGATVALAEGETLAILRYSLGSFAPDQPPACATLSFDLGDATVAPIDLTRNVVLTPIFSYGADALDNPTTDPATVGTPVPLPVTPRLLVVRKSIVAPEGETATGPNYPRQVRVEVGIANGATITALDLDDVLPGTLQFAGGTSVTGCGGAVLPISTPSTSTPGGTLTRRCTTVTGDGTPAQLAMSFDVYVPQDDALGDPVITPASPTRSIGNTASASGTYDPPGSAPPGTVTGSGDATIVAKLAPVRKGVTLSFDPAGNGPSHLDILTYRIEYELSDYFSVSLAAPGLVFTDVLGDGQTFLGCADAGTTIAWTVNGTSAGPQPLPPGTCSATTKDPATGETTITFDSGGAAAGTIGSTLYGDLATGPPPADPSQQGPTRIVVEFRARIDTRYSATPFPGPGSPALSLNDVVTNEVSANSSSGGQSAADDSSASTTIGAESFTKSIYAYNGTVPPPPGFLVAAGDTVTFRVRWDLSTATFEQAAITDFLPAPLFRVAGFTLAGDAAIAGSGTPPAAGRWTTGPADNFTTIGAVTADVAPAVATSGSNNSITWDYGTANLGLPAQVVDLLITVEATEEPFGDGLAFTNVGALTFENSVGAVSSASGTAAIETRAPALTIAKTVTASSSPACVVATPPVDYDDARSGCDAGDTIDFRLTLENAGRAPAHNVRIDDDGGSPSAGFGGSCTLLSVVDGNGAAVATAGSLFDTSANGGLSIATFPGDTSSTVSAGERVLVDYRCTIGASALPGLPDRRIDNTARLKYYANDPAITTDPAFNFASNQSFPGPNVRRARIEVANVVSIAKAIVASSVAQTTTPNVNSGETLAFMITLTLAEGVYQGYAFTDTQVGIPPIDCAGAGFTCSGNVSAVGTTVTVSPTTGSTPGVITYAYVQPKTASGSNTASFSATNVPASTAVAAWTLGSPSPVVSKSFDPNVADASDVVEVRLGWQNANAANPMFRCVITDPLDTVTLDPATIAAVTTPAGYAVAIDPVLGIVTYTATNLTDPCPDVPAGGAVLSAGLRATAVAGGSVGNTATLLGDTLPLGQPGGAAVTASGSAMLALGSPTIGSKVVRSSTEPDTVTADTDLAIGERITYRVTFTLPDGLTQAVRLVDEMRGGLANLVYIAGSARLSRNTVALTAAANPGDVNNAAPGAFVPVTPQCVGASPCTATQIRFDLGDVTNDPGTGTEADTYTLELDFRLANVAANTLGATRENRGQVVYRPAGATADQTINGGSVTVRVAGGIVYATKTVLAEGPPPRGTYTLTIANAASGPGAAPAFDWTFSDALPPTLLNPQLVLPLPPGVTASFSGNTLTGTIARLDPGLQVDLRYTVDLDPATPTGTTIVNAASVQATSLPGEHGTADATPGAPGAGDGERTGSGGVNDLFAQTSVPYTLGRLGLRKERTSPGTRYAIGDEVTYRVEMSVPAGTTTNVSIADTLPPGLAFVPGSASVSTSGGPVSTSSPGAPPGVAGQVVTFDFGTVTGTAAGRLAVVYRAVVTNVPGNQRDAVLVNAATLSYFDVPTGAMVSVEAANPPAISVAEPNLEIAKTVEAGAVGADAGDEITFRIVIENLGNATAHRVDLRDLLPDGLQQIAGATVLTSGQVRIDGTLAPVTTAHARVSTTTNPGDTLDLADAGQDGSDFVSLASGARLQIDFKATVMNTVATGQTLVNAVRVPYASQAACAVDLLCRDGSGGPAADDDDDSLLDNYAESAQASITIATGVTIGKTVAPAKAAVGQAVVFTHRVGVIEGTTAAVVFTDVLPPGLAYVSHAITVGNLGLVIGNPAYDTRLGAGQTVQFDFGMLSNAANGSTADDFVQIEITARVDNVAGNVDGTVLANGGEASASTVSVSYGSGPATTITFDADPSTAGRQGVPVEVIEPALALVKTATPASQALGGVVTFAFDVSHLAGSTSNAFDLVLVDTLPAGLAFVPGSVDPPGAFVSAVGQVVTLAAPSLTRAAGSASVRFQATIDPSATVDVALENLAELTWASVPGATGAVDSGRNGSGGLNDYVADAAAEVTPNADATIDATKVVAIATDADASGDLTPGDTLLYTVTLVNEGGPATNVVFTDSTPLHTTYVNGSATTSAGTIAGTDPLEVDVGPMAAGASVTITFRVTVDAGTPAGALIRNQGLVESDQTVPEPTDADGNDLNGDQPTDIHVAGGLPGVPLLRATKSVAVAADVDGSGSNTQGDRMRYTVVLANLGAVPLTALSLTDTIPAGLVYVAGSATASAGTIGVSGQDVTWSGIASLATGASVTASFDVTIASVAPPSQMYVNQGTAASAETGSVLTDGNASILDGAQPTLFVAVAPGVTPAPLLDVQKRWQLGADLPPAGVPSPGDTLIYTITVANLGSGPATNVRLVDPEPACAPPPGDCTNYVPGTLVTSQGAIVGTNPVEVNLGTIGVGASAVVSFQVRVDPTTQNGVTVANQASVTRDGDAAGVLSDDDGTPANGLNPTLTPISTSPSPRFLNLGKGVAGTSEPDVTSVGAAAVVGEVLRFNIAFEATAGTLAAVTIRDVMPPGLVYVPGSARLSRIFDVGLTATTNPGGINGAPSGSFVALADGSDVTVTTSPAGITTLVVGLGTVIDSDNDANAEGFVLEYRALVANRPSVQAGVPLVNAATVSWIDGLLQPQSLPPALRTVPVLEPVVQLAKSAAPSSLTPGGGIVRFTIVVRNVAGSTSSPAFDVRVVDVLPAVFGSYVVESITPVGASGLSTTTAGPLLTVGIARIDPGGQVTIVVAATTAGSLAPGRVSNTVRAFWSSLPGDQGSGADGGVTAPGASGSETGERNGELGDVNDYATSAEAAITVSATSIPTLSAWAMLLSMLSLALAGASAARRRRRG